MIKIQITQPYGKSPMLRQTPQEKGVWGNCKFFIDEPVDSCDFWFVIDDIPNELSKLSKNPPIFISLEFPSIRPSINSQFLAQFKHVLSFGRSLKHPNIVETIALFSWHIGIEYTSEGWKKTYKIYDDFLSPISHDSKNKLISVISSDKAFTEGHRKRLEFIEVLRKHFGDNIDIYGRGIRSFPDKWDVITPYKYHIALENSVCHGGISEKLYDAFLGEAFPIYYGCPNVIDYFNKDSLAIIDIDRPSESLSIIDTLISSNTYEKSLNQIRESKSLVLDKYNIFALLSSYCEKEYTKKTSASAKKYKLYPESIFNVEKQNPIINLSKKIKNGLKNLYK